MSNTEKHTCGRRMTGLGPWEREEHLDTWIDRDSVRACSFCGSMHPEDFLLAVESSCKVTPTDKSYKVYVDLPDPRAGQLRVISAITFEPGEDSWGAGRWVKVGRKQRRDLKRDGWVLGDYRYVMYAPRDTLHRKFYFQHLDESQRQRFIDLHNGGAMRLDFPGHFYCTPYFARAGAGS